MASISADEHKTICVQKMGEELGTQFAALWQEVTHINAKWAEYIELFGSRPERIDLLNDAAPTFFGLLQEILWEEAVLSIARLTDPPRSNGSGGRENLTIQSLPPLITDADAQAEADARVREAVDKCAFAKDWRNRRIAHRDLLLAVDDHATPLKAGSRASFNAALSAIESSLNTVEAHFFDSETHYKVGSFIGGAGELLYILYDGVRERQEREERISKGEFLERDTPPDL